MDRESQSNPYRFSEAQPTPEDAAATAHAAHSSTKLSAIAALLLVMGLLGGCNGAVGVGVVVFEDALTSLVPEPEDAATRDIVDRANAAVDAADVWMTPLSLVNLFVNLVLSAAFVVAAIGLFSHREWGRRLAVSSVGVTAVYTAFEIVFAIVALSVYGTITLRQLDEMSSLAPGGNPAAIGGRIGFWGGVIFTMALYVVEYAIYVYAWRYLRKDRVREAMH